MRPKTACFIVISTLILFLAGGCAPGRPGDPHGGGVFIPEETARRMGERAARRLESEVGLYESEAYQAYVRNVARRVASFSDRPGLDYQFEILDTFMVNAMALPGGYVYVTRGLLEKVETEAQLAAVLAHELGHISAYHSEKRTQLQLASIFTSVAAVSATDGRSLVGGIIGTDMLARGYTRGAEYEADELGMTYLRRAGYDPRAMIEFLTMLREESEAFPVREFEIMRTHPYLDDRVRRLNSILAGWQPGEEYMVNRGRYSRYKRQHLFTPPEKQALSRLEKFIDAYQTLDLETIREKLCSGFRLGTEGEESTEKLLEDLKKRFSRLEKINYQYQLLDLKTSKPEVRIIYSYFEEQYQPGEEVPEIRDGYQEVIWRMEEDDWCLNALR